MTVSVINQPFIDSSLDKSVCLCSVTLLPWYAFRFTWTKSERQTCAVTGTSVSSLRRLSESRCGPRACHRWPNLLPDVLRFLTVCLKECIVCVLRSIGIVLCCGTESICGRMCLYRQHITAWLFFFYWLHPAIFMCVCHGLLGSFNPALVLKRVQILDVQ